METPIKYCTNCGATLNNKDKFCKECGQKIEAKTKEVSSHQAKSHKPTDKKSFLKTPIGIGAIIVAIVVIGAFATVFSINNGNLDTNALEDMGLVKSEYIMEFYSDGSQSSSIESQVEIYKTNPYMKDDMNNDTIKWLETFDNNEYVYVSSLSQNFIMKRTDYDILKNQIDTSQLSSGYNPIEYFKVTIKANMVETHNLGSAYKDVIYIDNIDFVNSVKKTS